MTSNLGATALLDGINEQGEIDMAAQEQVMGQLRIHFRPEFLNRLDEIVVFNKLTDEDIKKIASIMLSDIAKRTKALNITLTFTDEVVSHLAQEGFDPVYGARPLRRAMQRKIEDSLSLEMLEGKISSGDSIEAHLEDNTIKYRKI